jgi:hypothetical protein
MEYRRDLVASRMVQRTLTAHHGARCIPERGLQAFEVALLARGGKYDGEVFYLELTAGGERAAVLGADRWVRVTPAAWQNLHLVRDAAPHQAMVTEQYSGRLLPIYWSVPVEVDVPDGQPVLQANGALLGFLADHETEFLRLDRASRRVYRLVLRAPDVHAKAVGVLPLMRTVA